MATPPAPTTPPAPNSSTSETAAAVDAAAQALLALFDTAREQAHTILSNSQLRALQVVERDEGLNLGALADAMGLLLSSASRLADRLIAAGMLDRTTSNIDRREVSLRLTVDGRALLSDLREDRRRRLDHVLAGMAPASRIALLRGLREFARVASKNARLDLSA
jgi:DNA-binding MarR family transcriptional regulator